jgi:endonuclease III
MVETLIWLYKDPRWCKSLLTSSIDKLRKIKGYPEELGLDLKTPEGRFQWFLASLLFAKRISANIAKKTFKVFQAENLVTPEAILTAGWDKLVSILDIGGYVRYDFSTATNLLEISRQLIEKFCSLEGLYAQAESPKHLEELLGDFRGIGPVGINIFLRELRGIWDKADPAPSHLAVQVAQKLGITQIKEIESQLVRINLEYCRKKACLQCPMKPICSTPILN